MPLSVKTSSPGIELSSFEVEISVTSSTKATSKIDISFEDESFFLVLNVLYTNVETSFLVMLEPILISVRLSVISRLSAIPI